jgi:subtilisin family serine protease
MGPAPDDTREELPAWSLPAGAAESLAPDWPAGVTRDWAFGGATGAGVCVAIVDSGVDGDHPLVGGVARSVAVSVRDGDAVMEEDTEGDLNGHGTACAGIVRSLAPEVELTSVRVLGADSTGSGDVLAAGLRWAVEEGHDIVNMSLSTRKRDWALDLHELADRAYFRRSMLVCSAHNLAIESFPWRFASVISVGSHEESDPYTVFYNPRPPVEFFGRGVDVEIAWTDGGTIRATGNSFATPQVAGLCALALSKHPELTPFQLKCVLYLTAANVERARGG